MSSELEAFANRVRRQSQLIMAAAAVKNDQRAFELAGALCTEAANILNQSQMQSEQAGEYDLAALPAPSGCADPE